MVTKVRIDARAHFASGESLHRHALATTNDAELGGAGEEYARSLTCHSPFDPSSGSAATELLAVAMELALRNRRGDAERLLDRAIAIIDAQALLYVPLAGERDELAGARDMLALRPRRASARP